MNKLFPILIGVTLIMTGLLALAFTLALPMLGISAWEWGAWRVWPLLVVSGGLCFVLPPLFARGERGLGALFIPGMPMLTTGGILLFTSVFDAWGAWAWLWPLEVLAVATGFLLAALYMRVIWLLIPAFVVGANGLLLQFCALTNLWEVWAVLWTIEPLSLGLAFLVIAAGRRSAGSFIAGLALCAVAAVGLVGMTAIFSGWWLVNLLGPVTLILIGVLALFSGLLRRTPRLPGPSAE